MRSRELFFLSPWSSECSEWLCVNLNRVEPGDPAASYVWHKLNGTQAGVGGSGKDMPTDD